MTKKSSRWSSGFTVSLVVGVLLACGGVRQDEFLCENAVAHLQGCCRGFNASGVECHYDVGCLDTTYPELDETQSSCILAESCATLSATGVCDRVAALPDEGLADGGTTPPVCAAAPTTDAGQTDGDDATEAEPTNRMCERRRLHGRPGMLRFVQRGRREPRVRGGAVRVRAPALRDVVGVQSRRHMPGGVG